MRLASLDWRREDSDECDTHRKVQKITATEKQNDDVGIRSLEFE